MAAFLHLLYSHVPRSRGGDQVQIKCVGGKNGKFNIRSFNVALRGSSPIFFPWKGIWGVNTPQRVPFFCLDDGMGEDPCDNFRKRGYTIVDWFCMCWCSEEGMNYLLIHCKVAYPLWCFVSKSVKIFCLVGGTGLGNIRRIFGTLFHFV